MVQYKLEIEFIDHSISAAVHYGTIVSAAEAVIDLVKRGIFDPVNIWAVRIEQK